MDPISFALGVIVALGTPGPTNTLLAASGAAAGFRRSLKLLPAEIGGYLLSISLLILVAGPFVAQHPSAAVGLKLAAGLWLIYCAYRLWREASGGFDLGGKAVSMRRVFITTLLNPKGLVFAFVIFPKSALATLGPWLAGFACLTAVIGFCWILVGALIARSAERLVTPQRIWRVAAVILASFAAILTGSAVAAVY